MVGAARLHDAAARLGFVIVGVPIRAARRLLAAALAVAAPQALAQSSLPPVPPPSALERELSEARVPVKRIVVEGVRSIPEADVRAAVGSFEGRSLGEGDLREIERRLTQLYLDRGFATSGVLLKRRPGAEGEAVFAAVEGTVAQVRFVTPPRYARPGWLTSLLIPRPDAPLRLDDLQERMTALREAGIVERINAEVVPLGAGGAELMVSVEEARPWDIELRYDNHHSPVVGARRPSLHLAHRNPSGWGDRFGAHVSKTDGLEDWHVEYSIPWPRSPWRFGARYEKSDSLAIDPPLFRDLAITSAGETRRGEVGYAWLSSASRSLSTTLAYERRDAESRLLGFPFSFVAGIPDGITKVDVVRASAEASAGGADAVLFLRAQWSAGKTNSDESSEGAPAKRFNALAFQGQYARRFSEDGAQLIARVDGQWTSDVLVPIEKKGVGGALSVRGFRENLLLRDRAVVGTVEARWPVWRWDDRARISVAAFGDAGWAKDTAARSDGLPSRIASIGVGLIASLPLGLSLRIDAALPNKRWLTENADWQDRGIHFQLSWNLAHL